MQQDPRRMWRTATHALLTLVLLLVAPSHAWAQQTLVVWHTENDPATLGALTEIGRRFSAEHAGVSVEFSFIGWNDIERRILTAVESGATPDLMQVEPHQVAYLIAGRHLQPLDDVLSPDERADIYSSVRDLQRYDDHTYGLPTALGISYFAIRRDLVPPAVRTESVDTWDDALRLFEACRSAHPDLAPLLLPANDLHLTILFSELLASNGGTLFDATGNPALNTPRVIETLAYLARLYSLVPPTYRNASYPENFAHFAQGRAVTLPGFFGRGTLSIMRQAPVGMRSPQTFGLIPHPRGPSAVRDRTPAVATVDSEPWVLPARARSPQLARDFLRFFYRPEIYMLFAASVPIHLTPVRRSLATSSEYEGLPHVRLWRPFHDDLLRQLASGTVLPIFMSRAEDRFRPALFRLEGSHIVPEMVREVYQGGTPDLAVRRAQERAQLLVRGLPLDIRRAPTLTSAPRPGRRLGPALAVGSAVVSLLFLGWLRSRRSRSP